MINTGTDHPVVALRWTRSWPGLVVVSIALLAGCGGGDHYLINGDITRRIAGDNRGAVNSLAGPSGEAADNGGGAEVSPQAQQVATLLGQALGFLRSGEPRHGLDKLLEAQLIEDWEHTPKAPAVVFWTGHAYEQVGEPNAAIAAFKRVITQYKDSPFAERAGRRLERLQKQLEDQPGGL